MGDWKTSSRAAISSTATDLHEFEAMLDEAGGSDGDLMLARERHSSLPAFVRSLVGLDREAAKHTLSHLTDHGAMPAERLYASPFTDIHAQGPRRHVRARDGRAAARRA